MKLRYSLFTRRQFLSGLIGGWVGAFLASLVYPIVKFIFPPYKEPDEVILPLADYKDMPPNSVKNFAWGTKLGLVKKNENGTFFVFVGVCTHLDCNVSYIREQKKFFCACHDGWYDENGINIGGPPPKPLRRLSHIITEEEFIVKRESPEEAS